jgi:hypothetical protein
LQAASPDLCWQAFASCRGSGSGWSIGILSIPLFAIAAITMFYSPAEPAQIKSGMNARLRFSLAAVAAVLLLVFSHDFETQFPDRVVRRDYTATVIATGRTLIQDFMSTDLP